MKQLRTAIETDHSVDDVFDSLAYTFERDRLSKLVKEYDKTKAVQMAAAFRVRLLLVQELNTLSCLQYRVMRLPWYVTFTVPQLRVLSRSTYNDRINNLKKRKHE